MAGAKRVPSSLVQLTTSIGCFVLMPRSFMVRTTSSAPSTPSTPSYLPPVGWVSRWLPIITGGRESSSPLRWANMVPMESTATVMPAASHHFLKRSRPSLSESVSVWRLLPPRTPGPIFAISMSESHRRSPLMRRLSEGIAMLSLPGQVFSSTSMKAIGLSPRLTTLCSTPSSRR